MTGCLFVEFTHIFLLGCWLLVVGFSLVGGKVGAAEAVDRAIVAEDAIAVVAFEAEADVVLFCPEASVNGTTLARHYKIA